MQGGGFLQGGPCEVVEVLGVWRCAEEAATVEDLLAEEALCHEERHAEPHAEQPEVR